jgi:hypothetical protein
MITLTMLRPRGATISKQTVSRPDPLGGRERAPVAMWSGCATRFGGGEDIALAQDLPVFSPGRGGVQ